MSQKGVFWTFSPSRSLNALRWLSLIVMVLSSVIPFISLVGISSVSKPMTINGETAYQVQYFQSYSLTSSAIANDSDQYFSGCYSKFVLEVVYSSYFYPNRSNVNAQLNTYGITFKVDDDYPPFWFCKNDGETAGWAIDNKILATTFFDGSSTVTGEGHELSDYTMSLCLTPTSLHIDFHDKHSTWPTLPDTISRYWSLVDGSNNEMVPDSFDHDFIRSMNYKDTEGFGYQSKADGFGFTYLEALNAVKDRVLGNGSTYNDGYRDGFAQGKEEGRQEATAEGSECAGSVDNVFSLFGKAFSSVADFFQMEVFGFLPLYWFFLAPIIAMIIAVIVKLV